MKKLIVIFYNIIISIVIAFSNINLRRYQEFNCSIVAELFFYYERNTESYY